MYCDKFIIICDHKNCTNIYQSEKDKSKVKLKAILYRQILYTVYMQKY